MSLAQVVRKFATEEKAERWFVRQRWHGRITCPACESAKIQTETTHPSMPYRCRACRRFFSVKTNTPMQSSKLPLDKWAIGLYLYSTNLKGVSSMKLHRDLDISQKSAWHMAHRIREMYDIMHAPFRGPLEVDETDMGGKEGNNHEWKQQNAGRGPVGKAAVVGMRYRATGKVSAEVIESTDARTLTSFVHERTEPGTIVFTDEAPDYNRIIRPHRRVKHSVKEFVNGMVHTNGMESVWAMLKRSYIGTHHLFRFKHQPRYVGEFTGRLNLKELDSEDLMVTLVRNGVGMRLTVAALIGPKNTRQPALIQNWS